jgi:uncharacterized protein (DUF1697 family)
VNHWIALLKAVNLGGVTMVPMAQLRELAGELGYGGVRTLLQSGNLLFSRDGAAPADLEAELETAMERRFGRRTTVFVRSPQDWAATIVANPFPDFARDDPGHMVVCVTKAAPTAAAVAALRAAIVGPEQVEAIGREVFFAYPDGVGASKLNIKLIERHLGGPASGRNWNTVLRIGKAIT